MKVHRSRTVFIQLRLRKKSEHTELQRKAWAHLRWYQEKRKEIKRCKKLFSKVKKNKSIQAPMKSSQMKAGYPQQVPCFPSSQLNEQTTIKDKLCQKFRSLLFKNSSFSTFELKKQKAYTVMYTREIWFLKIYQIILFNKYM